VQLAVARFWKKHMKYSCLCGAIFVAQASFFGPLQAEQAFPFLQPAAVRSAYELAQEGWQPATDTVRHAFLVAEDKHFLDRPAIRSTITAAITYWYPKRNGQPSLPVAAAIARALNHDEILEWFAHAAFLGQGCFGVDGAAAAYFNKSASELELHEAAFLAALVSGPAQIHPVRSHDRALARRNLVLDGMAEAGLISAQEASAAQASPLSVGVPLGTCPPEAD
jgi:hypothetical protein